MKEENWIEYESALNKAMDDYFNPRRQQLSRTKIQEMVFGGGFMVAWRLLSQPKEK